MINIYKKIEKNSDNPSGIVEIKDLIELDKPFLICISAQNNHDKSIYGLIRQGAQAARVYTTEENAARFKIDEMPVDFLGVRFIRDDNYQKNADEMVDKFIYPFLIKKGLNLNEVIKSARRMNFMTYCDGTMTFCDIEKALRKKLIESGFNKDDIKIILSQVSLVALDTMVNTGELDATAVTFIDVNDEEIYTEHVQELEDILKSRNKNIMYGRFGDEKNITYVYNGKGSHDLMDYFEKDSIAKPSLSSVIVGLLQNSIENEKNSDLYKITTDMLLNILLTYGSESYSPIDLIKWLDENINYGNIGKYTDEEAQIRHELDIAYNNLIKTRQDLNYAEKDIKEKDGKMGKVIASIRKYSSDIGFYQILISAGKWQAPNELDPFSEESDRSIREHYEKSKQI